MLPNLIIIGAQKCGTSALHRYLQLHPDIFMSSEKELNFFIQRKNWPKGLAWYESMFTGEAKVHGEASPDYTNYPAIKRVPELMHSIVPETKLIYMVRHPVERIVSQYMHNLWSDVETRPLSEALRGSDGVPMGETRYVRRSKYYMQVERYLEYFPKSRILIVTQEDLFQRRRETMEGVFRFLDVDDSFHSEKYADLIHESSDKPAKNRIGRALAKGPERGILRRLPSVLRRPAEGIISAIVTSKIERPALDEGLRQQLIVLLEEDIERFRAFAGRPFPDWTM